MRFSSHFPVLIRAVEMTTGPVLECGVGDYSTPVLHWLCGPKRRLVSLESDQTYYQRVLPYVNAWHSVMFVEDWDATPIEQPWDVAFVDHLQDRRRIEVARLAAWAKFVVVHDTEARSAAKYNLRDAVAAYRYNYTLRAAHPNTTVLSNTVENLEELFGWPQ